MNRNIAISKETLDKVRLAKKYIQDRYQTLLQQEIKARDNWNKIMASSQGLADLQEIANKINQEHSIQKRLLRKKDSLKNYKLYSLIGRGAFGEVRLAKEISTGQLVAIKRLKKARLMEKKQIYNAYLQKDFMGNCMGQYVVKLISAFQDEDYLYIAMEYVPGGDLLHLLIEKDILSEEMTKFYIAELVLAVEEVHKMGYIHRDIKPDNILLNSEGHVKISDFGLSKYVEPARPKGSLSKLPKFSHIRDKQVCMEKYRQKMFSKVGTPDYISPEVLTQATYDQSIDLWGIGVIMFECLYGYPPFTDDDSSRVCSHVINWLQYLQFPKDIKVSAQARMLMLGLITDRQRRLTIRDIKFHPFFEGIDWKNLHKKKAPYIPPLKDQLDVRNFDHFEIDEPWTLHEKNLFIVLNLSKDKAERQKTGNTTGELMLTEREQKKDDNFLNSRRNLFCFAGFDSKKTLEDPLTREVQFLARNSYSHKSLKKIKQKVKTSQKRLKTEQSQRNFCSSRSKNEKRIHMHSPYEGTMKNSPQKVGIRKVCRREQLLIKKKDEKGKGNKQNLLKKVGSKKLLH